jgi:coenzyme Q-binding protein COQ10
MTTFTTRRRVAFTPQQMYALVADVEKYPQFLPMCEALTITSRGPEGAVEKLVCEMRVGYRAIQERFICEVRLEPETPFVRVNYLEGPFRQLDNRWAFLPAPNGGCDIDFFIAYEFKSMMLQLLMGGMFDVAFRRFTEAFEQRAYVVYGTPGKVA